MGVKSSNANCVVFMDELVIDERGSRRTNSYSWRFRLRHLE